MPDVARTMDVDTASMPRCTRANTRRRETQPVDTVWRRRGASPAQDEHPDGHLGSRPPRYTVPDIRPRTRWEELLNFDAEQPSFKMHSGYINVTAEDYLFYWHFAAQEENPTADAPIVLWSNGGPVSKNDEFCIENEKLCIKIDDFCRAAARWKAQRPSTARWCCSTSKSPCSGTPASCHPIRTRGTATPMWFTWTSHAMWDSPAALVSSNPRQNLRFLVIPLRSLTESFRHAFRHAFTGPYVTSSIDAGLDIVQFIQGWKTTYPEHAHREWIIAAESYGGHYIPAWAGAILDHNLKAANAPLLNWGASL